MLIPDVQLSQLALCMQDVIAYLNGIDVYAVFLFKTLVAKIVGSLGSVGGGLAIGKEGPFVHIGACLALLLSQVWRSDAMLVLIYRLYRHSSSTKIGVLRQR